METATRYLVACSSCSKEYDALAEAWCDCLYKDRTIRCPHCSRCFCTAPISVKQRFWMDAPAEMWERKKKERARFVFTNAPLETLTRPLVLVVDDEDEIRAVAVRVVQDLGLSVVVARNGLEGIDVAAQYKPDIVVTDAMMPKLDGREMCLRIKENPETSGAKVVVLTSLYTDARYKYEAMKTFKADAYLSKPVEPQKLREVLQRFLS
jgi:CheY-like chemotaxis protein/DNA-directed RNA polymerase subunit RPC12/RpoP